MPPAGYPAFLQYLQSGRVRKFSSNTPRLVSHSPARLAAAHHRALIIGTRRSITTAVDRRHPRPSIVIISAELEDGDEMPL